MSSITVRIEGAEQIRRELKAMGGQRLRRVAKKVVGQSMRPVLGVARSNAPVGDTGRLRASLGQFVGANRRGDAFTARVGTRRDFTYKNVAGERVVSGRGKQRDRALSKGYSQDAKTAQQYARLIEFGEDSKGRISRKAGGAHFLDNAILSNQTQMIETVSDELRRHINTST